MLAPRWGFDLDEVTRTVLTAGLPTRVSRLRAPLGDGAWSALRATCGRHRLDGLLVATVASGHLPATEAQCAEVALLELELTRSRMWHEARAAQIVDIVVTAGCSVRVLKGPALAALDYPDAQWRPTQDLDLLVRGAHLDTAVRALVAHGGVLGDFPVDRVPGFAATVGKGTTVRMPDGLEVDLHRLLAWGPLGVRVPEAELWERFRTFDRAGRTFTTLGLEESLLHAAMHAVIGGWRRALTLRDVVQLLSAPALDPERLLRLAHAWGSEAVLAAAVLLTDHEIPLHTRPPSATLIFEWAAGYHAPLRDQAWLRVQRPDSPIPFVARLGTLLELPTAKSRWTLLEATARTARDSVRSAGLGNGFRLPQRLGRPRRRQ